MSSKWNNFLDNCLPYLWGAMICGIVTGGLIGTFIVIIKWLCKLLGVM